MSTIMSKLLSFTILATATTVVMAMTCCSEVTAQERPLDATLLLQTRKLDTGSLQTSERKDAGGLASMLKEYHISVQIFDIFEYLVERRGKIILYSALEHKLTLELGLFGYLGVRWQFQ